MTLGEKIVTYREAHNMSARAFAKLAGLSNTYISTIERGVSPRGDITVPSIDTYRACASAMGLTLEELIHEVDDLVMMNTPPARDRLTDDEAEFLSYYRDAEEPIRKAAKTMLRDSAEENQKKERPASVS